ncbi:hypothetical protein BH18ACI5_BH18ACI5_18510 [soil metagenome]
MSDFLRTNGAWIVNEFERIERLRSIRRPKRQAGGAILYRGELTPVRVDEDRNRGGANKVMFNDRQLVILRSTTSRTAPSVSLENWLRKQAREEILRHLNVLTARLKREPHKVLIMGQRTKWGNCSAGGRSLDLWSA